MMHMPPSPPLSTSTSFSLPESSLDRTRTCMDRYTAAAKRSKFIKRLFKLNHMDFQFALWQMYYLFVTPQKVFRDFVYRKRIFFYQDNFYFNLFYLTETKNQFARDDPAFLVLLSIFLISNYINK